MKYLKFVLFLLFSGLFAFLTIATVTILCKIDFESEKTYLDQYKGTIDVENFNVKKTNKEILQDISINNDGYIIHRLTYKNTSLIEEYDINSNLIKQTFICNKIMVIVLYVMIIVILCLFTLLSLVFALQIFFDIYFDRKLKNFKERRKLYENF